MHPRNALADKLFATCMAVLCIGVSSVLLACRSDRRESFYPSLADADKDGAITRGWIPRPLPGSSRAIHEVHEISPPMEWCTFEFLPTDSQTLRNSLQRVDSLPRAVSRVPNPGVSWWPAVLSGNLDVEKIHRDGFDLYVFATPETSVTTAISLYAIDLSKGRGFLYSTRG